MNSRQAGECRRMVDPSCPCRKRATQRSDHEMGSGIGRNEARGIVGAETEPPIVVRVAYDQNRVPSFCQRSIERLLNQRRGDPSPAEPLGHGNRCKAERKERGAHPRQENMPGQDSLGLCDETHDGIAITAERPYQFRFGGAAEGVDQQRMDRLGVSRSFGTYFHDRYAASFTSVCMICRVPFRRSSGDSHERMRTTRMSGRSLASVPWPPIH